MRFLANENMPRTVIRALREAGHDVAWIRETSPGATDRAVLSTAQRESRILLTQDKDFGELAFRARLPSKSGIVLFRLSGSDPDEDIRRMITVLDQDRIWSGHFTVVTSENMRMRPLPAL